MRLVLFIVLFAKGTLFSVGQEIDIREGFSETFRLEGDSGFVQKREGDRILNFLADKIDISEMKDSEKQSFWKESDTIGKFIYLQRRIVIFFV